MRTTARIAALLWLVQGCAALETTPNQSIAAAERRLVILHASDLESELIGSGEDGPGIGGIGRFVAVVEALRSSAGAPSITLAAGDLFMPAPALQLELEGRNVVATANGLIGFDASALGNHEFDRGEEFLAEQIRSAPFPFLTATIDFDGGPLGALEIEPGALAGRTPWLADHPGRILPRGLLCAGGELVRRDGAGSCTGLVVGVIGATTETLLTISSMSVAVGMPRDFDELRNRIQAQADALAAEGVDIVVLVSHLQDVERELALVEGGLVGVDLIVSGGGDDRLANPADRLLAGDIPHRLCGLSTPCYPLLRTARDGKQVAVVAGDGQLRYVGRIGLRFDAAGGISSIDPDSRPWPVDDRTIAALQAAPAPVAAALEAQVLAALQMQSLPIANSAHFLDGERESVRNRETNLGDLAADSMVWAAGVRLPDAIPLFAIRNGGGIRASIGSIDRQSGRRSGGAISMLEISEALRFDNELVLVRAPRRVLIETIESALRGAGTGRGHFPQVSEGLELVYDPAAPEAVLRMDGGEVVGVARPGARIRTLVLGDSVLVEEGRTIEPEASVLFVTLAYLARGGDGWFPGAAAREEIEILPLGIHEQEALGAYLGHLQRSGTWSDGAAYAAPEAANPASFRRIRQRQ